MLKLLPSLSLEQYKNHKVSWLNWLFRKRAIDLILLTPSGPSGSTWDHMGPHMGPQLQRNLESLALQLAILGSIPQKIWDLLGKFRRSNPNSSWIFRGFIFLNVQAGQVVFFLMECFLKVVGDFHGVYRNTCEEHFWKHQFSETRKPRLSVVHFVKGTPRASRRTYLEQSSHIACAASEVGSGKTGKEFPCKLESWRSDNYEQLKCLFTCSDYYSPAVIQGIGVSCFLSVLVWYITCCSGTSNSSSSFFCW